MSFCHYEMLVLRSPDAAIADSWLSSNGKNNIPYFVNIEHQDSLCAE
jgi:hypothetical protein